MIPNFLDITFIKQQTRSDTSGALWAKGERFFTRRQDINMRL